VHAACFNSYHSQYARDILLRYILLSDGGVSSIPSVDDLSTTQFPIHMSQNWRIVDTIERSLAPAVAPQGLHDEQVVEFVPLLRKVDLPQLGCAHISYSGEIMSVIPYQSL
jgi:hypothetical protein